MTLNHTKLPSLYRAVRRASLLRHCAAATDAQQSWLHPEGLCGLCNMDRFLQCCQLPLLLSVQLRVLACTDSQAGQDCSGDLVTLAGQPQVVAERLCSGGTDLLWKGAAEEQLQDMQEALG